MKKQKINEDIFQTVFGFVPHWQQYILPLLILSWGLVLILYRFGVISDICEKIENIIKKFFLMIGTKSKKYKFLTNLWLNKDLLKKELDGADQQKLFNILKQDAEINRYLSRLKRAPKDWDEKISGQKLLKRLIGIYKENKSELHDIAEKLIQSNKINEIFIKINREIIMPQKELYLRKLIREIVMKELHNQEDDVEKKKEFLQMISEGYDTSVDDAVAKRIIDIINATDKNKFFVFAGNHCHFLYNRSDMDIKINDITSFTVKYKGNELEFFTNYAGDVQDAIMKIEKSGNFAKPQRNVSKSRINKDDFLNIIK